MDLSTTTVIFLTDNGRLVLQPFPSSATKGTLKEGGVAVPMIVAGQAVAPSSRGRETEALVQASDLFATVLEIAGVPGWAPDSVSILPCLEDPDTPSRRAWIHSEHFLPNGDGPLDPAETGGAARTQRYKLIRMGGMPDEFYDLATDPLEVEPLDIGSLDAEAREAHDLLADALLRAGADRWAFYLDRLEIERNGQIVFADDFSDGASPPSAPPFADLAPAHWSTAGAPAEGTEREGRLRLEEADGTELVVAGATRRILAGQLLRDGSPAVIEAHDVFSLAATFELVIPREVGAGYGLRLQAFAEAGVGDPAPGAALELSVSRTDAEQVQIEFLEVDDAGAATLLAAASLDTAHEQIRLRLGREAPLPGPVQASFVYVDDGVPGAPTVFGVEGHPFASASDVATGAFFAGGSSRRRVAVPALSGPGLDGLVALIGLAGFLAARARRSRAAQPG